jgi:hypothetical protein
MMVSPHDISRVSTKILSETTVGAGLRTRKLFKLERPGLRAGGRQQQIQGHVKYLQVWWNVHLVGWWFQTCFFHFLYGMSSFPLTNIFQDG